MNSVVLREANEADLPAAAELWIAMFEEMGTYGASDFTPEWRQCFCRYFARRMAADQARYFVGETNGAIVATAAAIIRDRDPLGIDGQQTGFILGVSVLPAYRRRGLAKRLTQRCVEWLKSLGCKRIRLHASNAARSLYESMGFTASSEMELVL